jgi:hypothetical protein
VIGSTFIHTLDASVLIGIAGDIEAIERASHVEMDELITLDFESVCSSVELNWSASEPIAFDEGAGFAIFKIESTGLQYVLNHKDKFLPEQLSDIEMLDKFVTKYGFDNIYEFATF